MPPKKWTTKPYRYHKKDDIRHINITVEGLGGKTWCTGKTRGVSRKKTSNRKQVKWKGRPTHRTRINYATNNSDWGELEKRRKKTVKKGNKMGNRGGDSPPQKGGRQVEQGSRGKGAGHGF